MRTGQVQLYKATHLASKWVGELPPLTTKERRQIYKILQEPKISSKTAEILQWSLRFGLFQLLLTFKHNLPQLCF